jgi:hypothetical protein
MDVISNLILKLGIGYEIRTRNNKSKTERGVW